MVSRRNFRKLLLGTFLLAANLHPAVASTHHDSLCAEFEADSILALEYAPILWFESGEKYFPTIPFFTAFTWNPRAHSRVRLTPELLRPEHSWDGLLRAYDAHVRSHAPHPEVWVFWDKQTMSVKDLQRLLSSDRQFHNRSHDYFLLMRQEVTSVAVFRYWMYYLNDTGLQGHPQDIEFVYVFVPVWREELRQERGALPRPLAVVGAGHTEMVPNNVLLCDTPLESVVILTELGGHASAPDRNGDGALNPGYDANWQAANIWGTRDTQASSGLGAFGNYQSWMTFPRKPEQRCFPPQEKYQSAWHYRLERVADLKKLYDDIATLQQHKQLLTPDDSTRWQNMAASFARLGGPERESWFEMAASQRGRLLESLQGWWERQWTYKRNPETGVREKHFHNKLEAAKHMPWRHSYFTSPVSRIFKPHIFPPTGDWNHWMRGAYLRYAGYVETSAGLILHVTEPPGIRNLFKLPGVIVLETGYRWVSTSGRQIVGSGCDDHNRKPSGTNQLSARLLYDVKYNTLFTGYFGWGAETDWKKSDFNNTRKFFCGGVKAEYHLEWLPWRFDFLQVRVGVRVPNAGHRLCANRTRLDLQIGWHR